MKLDLTTTKRLSFLIVLFFLLFAAVQHPTAAVAGVQFLFKILSPFLIGAALAFILNVPMRALEQHLFSSLKQGKQLKQAARPVSLLVTLLLVLLVILLLFLVVLPQLSESVTTLGTLISGAVPRFLDWAESLFASNPQVVQWLNSLTFDWDAILASVVNFLRDGAGNMVSSTISVAKSLLSAIATFFIAFVFACYLLLQKETLGRQFRKVLYALLPTKNAEYVLSVTALSNRVFSSFITGQCLEALILGSMFFLVMTVFRLPYALLIGCLIAVTALIPIVGAFIGCAVGVFLLLMISPSQALLFLVLFLVLQQIEGNLIYPHVVGSSVGLPSIWVLAAVSLGGNLFGVGGMLLFIPLISVVYSLFRDFVNRRLQAQDIQIDSEER